MSAAFTVEEIAACRICKDGRDVYCPVHDKLTPQEEFRQKIAAYLARSAELRGASDTPGILKNSTLLLEGGKHPYAGNLFVSSMWADARPHLAAYLMLSTNTPFTKWNGPSFRVLTDNKLIDNKFTSHEDDPEPFATRIVRDAVLILYLGIQQTSNRELPGLVYETIKIRELAPKRTTILVNEPTSPWRDSHKAYSKELDDYITETFTRIVIKKKS